MSFAILSILLVILYYGNFEKYITFDIIQPHFVIKLFLVFEEFKSQGSCKTAFIKKEFIAVISH